MSGELSPLGDSSSTLDTIVDKIATTLRAVSADSDCGELGCTLSHLKTLGGALGGCVSPVHSVHSAAQLVSGTA